ncbi:MAG: PA14 domain-containing protein, partial [Anaerolineae bacterium]|nr:PA14 domain-containing protein [Anaerolineae bacterium]
MSKLRPSAPRAVGFAQAAARVVWLLPAVFAVCPASEAQTFRRLGTEFAAMRGVAIGTGKRPAIVVVQFFHHGQLRDDGRNLAVFAKSGGRPAPSRVLQVGPGDFCRVAFQTLEGQTAYEIFYGGEPPKEEPPPWTSQAGLLLETREFKNCNLHSAASVREAFEASRRLGGDYVDGLHHADNPFALRPGPFLSRYTGYLHLAASGTYGFITSSQDCSFVWIDGKLVTEHPGVHPPRHQARPGFRNDVALAAGTHALEYYHASAGPSAVMSLTWEVNPIGPAPRPAMIPPEVFAAEAVGREMPGPPATR